MFRQSRNLGSQTNQAVRGLTEKIDGQTADVAGRAAKTIVVAVRLLRIPTAAVGLISLPFIVTTLALGWLADGADGLVILLAGAAMAVVNGLYWWRRHRIMTAVAEPDQLATELGILVSMSGKVDETRGVLAQVAGGGGWRIMNRLRGAWSSAHLAGHWIEGVGDLKRARYFAPPKIGTTVTLAISALWLIPVSIVVALFVLVATAAGTV
ncbi:hypothetical protein [Aeromicrobium sp. UC242_57]|uniref:hypothetical protein n=1 Tax=Aeromicrobium sp. UC242_57 TaxID=3374624 RepID=UPI0037AAA882